MRQTADEKLLLQFTGQTAIRDLATAQGMVAEWEAKAQAAREEHRKTEMAYNLAALRLLQAKLGLELWVLCLLVCVPLAFSSAMLSFFVLRCEPVTVFTVMALFLAFPVPALIVTFRDSNGETSQSRRPIRAKAVDDKRIALIEAKAKLDSIKSHLNQVIALRDGIRRAIEHPIAQLLQVNFDLLSGDAFEQFLAQVFYYTGYSVEHVGQSKDHGVDLILTHSAFRIAIQAKRYSGPVSNDAVQQVFTGMAIYRCHRCVVVTNSFFTDHARDAASRTGCLLIEGTQLRGLIKGEIRL